MREVPRPEPQAGEVLVRVLKTGICGTDIHIYDWDHWAEHAVAAPLVVGHEFVGEVVELGAGVEAYHVGEIVSAEGHLVCGRCRNCMAGRRWLCANSRGIGVQRDGAFAEYIVMPAGNLWAHHPSTPLEVASIFDPFGNAVHTAMQFSVAAEDVLITGAGPIGIMAAAVARHLGARHIVITDLNAYRLKLAETLGVTRAVDPTRTPLETVQKELGMTEGFDVAFEMSGKVAAVHQIFDNMAHGGRIAALGLPSDDIAVDWSEMVLKMLTLRGVYGRQMFETWYQMSVFVESGLDISPLITHRYDADDYEEAFATVRSGESGKVILNWRT
jgi:threonine 3-dehydrogenase